MEAGREYTHVNMAAREDTGALVTPHRLLLAVSIAFVVLALSYSVVVPLGEAPDEVSHYSYVRHLASERTLPRPAGTVFGEVFQPPLYYALVAPATAWAPWQGVPVDGSGDFELDHPTRRIRVLIQPAAARWPWSNEAMAWHLVRGISAVFGLVTVLATYGLARTVLPHRTWSAPLAAAFVAFVPQFTFQSGVVTNDTPAAALSALLLLVLARNVTATRSTDTPQHSAFSIQYPSFISWSLAGLLGGLGVWTKSSGWVFVGTAGLAWLLTWQHKGSCRRLAALAGTWAVVTAPWLVWNWTQYGDPLGWALLHQVTDERTALSVPVFLDVLRGLYRTFWAGFGGAAHLSFPTTVNVALGLLLVTAIPGTVRLFRRRDDEPVVTRLLVPWLGVHTLLVGLAWVQWTRTVLGTGQGRLLFPALPAIAVLLAAGWATLFPSSSRRTLATAGTLLFAGISTAALVFFLRPLYTAPPTLAAPADTVEANWYIGDRLLLHRYTEAWTVDDHLPPGTEREVYLEWEATQPVGDLRLLLQMIDSDGEPVWIKEGTPSAGRDTTDQWRTGERVGAWHRVQIPEGTDSGWYRIMLSLHPAGSEHALDITTAEGDFIGERVMIGQVTVTDGD